MVGAGGVMFEGVMEISGWGCGLVILGFEGTEGAVVGRWGIMIMGVEGMAGLAEGV